MAWFQSKKTRTRTAPIRPHASLLHRIDTLFHNQRILPRLTLGFITLIFLVIVLEGWKPVFPYRLGDRVESGITASIAFQIEDEAATKRLWEERKAEVPIIFEHDPEPLKNLTARLKNALTKVAQTDDLNELDPELRRAFGLIPTENSEDTPLKIQQRFSSLRKGLSADQESSGLQIEAVSLQFEQFIEPLYQAGILPQTELVRLEIEGKQPVEIRTSDENQEPTILVVNDILLSEAVKDAGRLGQKWSFYADINSIRQPLTSWMVSETPTTLKHLPDETRDAKLAAEERAGKQYITYQMHDILVKPGERITPDHIKVLKEEFNALQNEVSLTHKLVRIGTVIMMLVVLLVLLAYFLMRQEPKLFGSVRQLSLFAAVIVITLGSARLLSHDPWRAEVIPILATVMIFSIAYNQMLATVTALMLSLLITITTVAHIGEFIVLISVSTVATLPLASVSSRSSVVKVGFWAGAVYFLVSLGNGLIQAHAVTEILTDPTLIKSSFLGAIQCIVAGYLVAGSLPFIEASFGIVTDISLLEMSDISHPLLQELIQRAPGTYNHSVSMATIGEAAAESIGANGLLLRVGAYFHDIGKMLKPQYFIENVGDGEKSRHEDLAPAMSTLVIIGHVKDGVDLARQHNLPQVLIDFIEQHHGTTLVEYFYREAQNQADADPDHKTDAEESSFRYPGPKPQSKEAGIMMLADAVESASRTLSEPTPKRIDGLVHGITMKRLLDGQFDESSLTLSEIRKVEDSLIKSLIGVYHGRIKYPEQKRA